VIGLIGNAALVGRNQDQAEALRSTTTLPTTTSTTSTTLGGEGFSGSTRTEDSTTNTQPVEAPPSAEAQYLADLTRVEGYDFDGSVKIKGREYLHGLAFGLGWCSGSRDGSAVYNVGSGFARFEATMGLSDLSRSEARIRLQVFVDDKMVVDELMRPGQDKPLVLDITGAYRIRLAGTITAGYEESCEKAGYAAWGDARFVA